MRKTTKILGNYGESFVCDTMQKKGYTILARNYRTSYGEIDIIAQKGNTISFVEVKTRNTIFFDISQVVTPTKQKKIIMVAKTFLSQHHFLDTVYQFDIALLEHNNNKSDITYIANAFYGHE